MSILYHTVTMKINRYVEFYKNTNQRTVSTVVLFKSLPIFYNFHLIRSYGFQSDFRFQTGYPSPWPKYTGTPHRVATHSLSYWSL